MSIKQIITCDLCEMDGYENIKATARYKDMEGREWFVCNKHLEDVKEADLPYLLLEQGGEKK